MRPALLPILLSIFFISVVGCGLDSNPPSPQSDPDKNQVTHTDGAPPGSSAGINALLGEAARDQTLWPDLKVVAECRGSSGWRSVEIYGHGVGIWDRRSQFSAPPEMIAAILGRLQSSDIGSFQDVYGSRGGVTQEQPQVQGPPKVTCQVRVELAGATKQAIQLDRGRPHQPLLDLAEGILNLCQEAGSQGQVPASLQEGLEKLADGDLAPQGWMLLFQQSPTHGGQSSAPHWLHVAGTRATARVADNAGGAPRLVALELHPESVTTLARSLADARLEELPGNLYATVYTDLSTQVLAHRKSIQARDFARMNAASHGALQDRFDNLVGLLRQLSESVQRDGVPIASEG